MAKKHQVQKAEPKKLPQPADLRPLQHYANWIKDQIFRQWVSDRTKAREKRKKD